MMMMMMIWLKIIDKEISTDNNDDGVAMRWRRGHLLADNLAIYCLLSWLNR